MTPAKHLLFLHIQKTAGSTFHNILSRQYKRKNTFNVFHALRDPESFGKLPPEKRKELRLVKGHFPFGLHHFFEEPCEYITVLRDPTERTISHFYHASEDPKHYFYETITSNKYTLADMLEKGIMPNLENNMVRMFSGKNMIPFGTCTEEMLETAMKNLAESFPVIGLQSHFDAFVLQCARRYRWNRLTIHYRKARVGKTRPQQKQLDDHTLGLIKKYNALDQRLYDHWKPIILANLANESDAFRKKTAAFKRNNQLINSVLSWFS